MRDETSPERRRPSPPTTPAPATAPTPVSKPAPTTAPTPAQEPESDKQEVGAQIDASLVWVTDDFDLMNQELRNPGGHHCPQVNKRRKRQNEDFTKALTSDRLELTRYDPELVLYRGVSAEYIRHFEEGKNYKVAGFCSTSMSKKVARRFADGVFGGGDDDSDDECEKGTLLQIIQSRTNPKGRILCSGLLQPHFPTDNDEQEVTFPPGTSFHIEGVDYMKSGNYSKIVYLRELDDEVAV